jgi:Skp family chaperone for outer membrane proteins
MHPEKKPPTVGFVDVQKVFENSSRGKQHIAAFQEELNARSEEVNDLSAKVDSLRKEIEGLLQRGQHQAAERKVPQFQEAQQKLLAAQQKANEELQKTQAEVDKAFMHQLKTVLDELRVQEQLDVIQAYDPNKTLSFNPGLDITDKTLARYNQTYPPEPPANLKAREQGNGQNAKASSDEPQKTTTGSN